MKSEGSGDRQRMLRLSFMASKFGFFLIAFVSIPCLFEMNELLKLWLGKVPQYCVLFCISIAIAIMIDQITVGLNAAIQATKLVKESALTVGIIKMLIVPVAYLLLKLGYGLVECMIGYAAIEAFAGVARIILLHQKVDMNIKSFIRKVVLQLISPIIAVCIFMTVMVNYIHFEFRFLCTIPISIVLFLIFTYFFSLSLDENSTLSTFFNLEILSFMS